MNMASRMESTGRAGCVQVSETTAQILLKAGKSHWVVQRPQMINIKGKGPQQTYWLVASDGAPFDKTSLEKNPTECSCRAERDARLVKWTKRVLEGQLRKVLATRSLSMTVHFENESLIKPVEIKAQELISFPPLQEGNRAAKRAKRTKVTKIVQDELEMFVVSSTYPKLQSTHGIIVAKLYDDHPFHNFAHASHVVMSMAKFANVFSQSDHLKLDATYTHGVSDPLTVFAMTMAALVRKFKAKVPINVSHNSPSRRCKSFDL